MVSNNKSHQNTRQHRQFYCKRKTKIEKQTEMLKLLDYNQLCFSTLKVLVLKD